VKVPRSNGLPRDLLALGSGKCSASYWSVSDPVSWSTYPKVALETLPRFVLLWCSLDALLVVGRDVTLRGHADDSRSHQRSASNLSVLSGLKNFIRLLHANPILASPLRMAKRFKGWP
jgi:hypothetical protein